jgi:hypothetical protein
LHADNVIGKFHGATTPTTPTGSRVISGRASVPTSGTSPVSLSAHSAYQARSCPSTAVRASSTPELSHSTLESRYAPERIVHEPAHRPHPVAQERARGRRHRLPGPRRRRAAHRHRRGGVARDCARQRRRCARLVLHRRDHPAALRRRLRPDVKTTRERRRVLRLPRERSRSAPVGSSRGSSRPSVTTSSWSAPSAPVASSCRS